MNIGASAPVVSIGRAVDCTIRSNRKSVSRHHAEFRYSNGQFEIIDLNSSNGTYLIINEQRRPVMGREYVTHNDEVWCGDFILRFFEQDEIGFDATANAAPGDMGRPQMATFDSIPPKPMIGDSAGSAPPQFATGPTVPPERSTQGNWADRQSAGWAKPSDGQQSSWIEEPRQAQSQPSAPAHASSQPQPPAQYPEEPIQDESAFVLGNEDQFRNDLQAAISDELQVGDSAPPSFQQGASWAEELAAESNTNWQQVPRQDSPMPTMDDPELDRILAEKRSIEDMASRQQQEIERLENLLDDMRNSDAPAVSPNTQTLSQLEAELSESQDEVARLEQALGNQSKSTVRTDELEGEIDELRRLNNNMRAELSDLREQFNPEMIETLENEVEKKTQIVIELENDIDVLRRKLDEQSTSQNEAESLTEELTQLRDEVKRKERLVVEFEKRNRELQHDLSLKEEIADTLAEKVTMLEADAADDNSAQEIADLKSQLEAAQNAPAPRQQSDIDRIETLESEVSALRDALQAASERSEATVATDTSFTDLKPFLEQLERLVDAIDRTDLAPLSTVDRVRLQSAIRDTDPKATLKKLLDSL